MYLQTAAVYIIVHVLIGASVQLALENTSAIQMDFI